MSKSLWYVESDGRGPYVCEERAGRVCTIENQAFARNGGRLDWQRARLIAAAPSLLEQLEVCTAALENVLLHLGNQMTPADQESRTKLVEASKRLTTPLRKIRFDNQ